MVFGRKSLPFIYGGCGNGGTKRFLPKKKPIWRGNSNLFINTAKKFKQPSLISASHAKEARRKKNNLGGLDNFSIG